MSEKKLKLTLHGKCVGYELHRFDPDYGGMMIEHLPPSQARAYPVAPCHHVSNNYIQHDAVHDFVCLDRNGNAVYEGDIVMAWGRPRIVVWFPNSLVYRLESEGPYGCHCYDGFSREQIELLPEEPEKGPKHE